MDTISTNTSFIVATPVKPTDKSLMQKISGFLTDLDDVREAHLPSVIELGYGGIPQLTLFVVVTADASRETIHKTLTSRMGGRFSNTGSIALQIVTDTFPLLQAIRDTGCVVGWRD